MVAVVVMAEIVVMVHVVIDVVIPVSEKGGDPQDANPQERDPEEIHGKRHPRPVGRSEQIKMTCEPPHCYSMPLKKETTLHVQMDRGLSGSSLREKVRKEKVQSAGLCDA